jgi:hypothetical protein
MRELSHIFLEQSERIYYLAIVSWTETIRQKLEKNKGPAQEPRSLRDGAWTGSKAFSAVEL